MADEFNRFDLEQAEKKARSLAKSDVGRQALANVLGIKATTVDKDGTADKPIVAILVPSHYSPKPQMTAAFGQMVAYAKNDCYVLARPSMASSVVHWVRNQLLAKLYQSGDPFTHVLFIDDDIVPPEDSLSKMLAADKPIIGAACTVRQDPPHPNFRTFDESNYTFKTAFEWNGDGVMQIAAVGTGMMLIRRDALEKVAEYYLNCYHETKWFGMTPEMQKEVSARRRKIWEEKKEAWWFEFLKHPYGDGEFGEDISFCTPAGSWCYGPKTTPIEKLWKGDYTFSHTGKGQEITATITRQYKGKLVNFTVAGTPPIRLTPQHRVLTEGGWKKAQDLTVGEYVTIPKPQPFVDKEQFVDIIESIGWDKNLTFDDKGKLFYRATHNSAAHIPARIPLDLEFGRLCGYYLSEGYPQVSGLGFAFNGEEGDYIDDIKKLACDLFDYGNITTKREPGVNGGSFNAYLHSRLLAKLMVEMFGKGSGGKHLPDGFGNMPAAFIKGIIIGFWRGDGHCIPNAKAFGMTTVSERLARELRAALLRFGIFTSLRIRKAGAFVLETPSICSDRFGRFIGETDFADRPLASWAKFKEDENNFYAQVTSAQWEEFDGDVFNLSVDSDESYNIDGVAVHNCFKAMQLGIPVYVDTTIRPLHIGDYGYSLSDFLQYQQSYLAYLKEQEQAKQAERDAEEVLVV